MCPATVLSGDFKRYSLASNMDDVLVCLIAISHPDMAATIRVSSDPTEQLGWLDDGTPKYGTVSNGEEYLYYQFGFTLPGQPSGTETPEAAIVLDNVDRVLVRTIRELHEAPRFACSIVLASNPDRIEYALPKLILTGTDWDAAAINGRLTFATTLQRTFPPRRFLPSNFPGLF
ncbi:DUF1833 family protein [Nitratidesulfovibrio sp. 1201_IL3209]|uniref:DUF1833 family protein n=1 Tax=Nitratidesulfovibrio sp. 1201_IL3209 TaxID=3084053 RepID=UPI002FDB844D